MLDDENSENVAECELTQKDHEIDAEFSIPVQPPKKKTGIR